MACRRSQLEEHGSGFAVAAEDPVRSDPALLPYAWGVDPVDMGVGGSIPFTSDFAAQFSDGAIIVTGEGSDARSPRRVRAGLRGRGALPRPAGAQCG